MGTESFRISGQLSRIKDEEQFTAAKKKSEKEKSSCPKVYLSLFPITPSHPHSQSPPPNAVNGGW
jgi:hypothetical protein